MTAPLTASLTREERALMMTLPKMERVQRTPGNDAMRNQLQTVSSLRQRGLITIRLDWDASTPTHIARHLALTQAGLEALHGGSPF